MIEFGQTATLMVIYGVGFLLVFLCFALLYAHAYKMRAVLELDDAETYDTVTAMRSHLIESAIGLVAVLIALLIGNQNPMLSSAPYWFIGPIMAFHGMRRGKKKMKLHLQSRDS